MCMLCINSSWTHLSSCHEPADCHQFQVSYKSLPNLSGLLKFLHDNMELDTFELFKRKQMKIMSTCTHFHTHTKSLSDGDPRGKRKAQDSSH